MNLNLILLASIVIRPPCFAHIIIPMLFDLMLVKSPSVVLYSIGMNMFLEKRIW